MPESIDRWTHPPELKTLLEAKDERTLPEAWDQFLRRYSDFLLHCIRSRCNGYDAEMERYTFVLEALKADDFGRLRRYAADGRGTFQTWLAVVVRRLCEDYRRSRYGRAAGGDRTPPERERDTVRRRLVDFIMVEIDPSSLIDHDGRGPEMSTRRGELTAALEEALAALHAEDRVLLQLRFQDDLPAREIARILDLPTAFHVYRRVRSRLKELRNHLLSHGIGDPHP